MKKFLLLLMGVFAVMLVLTSCCKKNECENSEAAIESCEAKCPAEMVDCPLKGDVLPVIANANVVFYSDSRDFKGNFLQEYAVDAQQGQLEQLEMVFGEDLGKQLAEAFKNCPEEANYGRVIVSADYSAINFSADDNDKEFGKLKLLVAAQYTISMKEYLGKVMEAISNSPKFKVEKYSSKCFDGIRVAYLDPEYAYMPNMVIVVCKNGMKVLFGTEAEVAAAIEGGTVEYTPAMQAAINVVIPDANIYMAMLLPESVAANLAQKARTVPDTMKPAISQAKGLVLSCNLQKDAMQCSIAIPYDKPSPCGMMKSLIDMYVLGFGRLMMTSALNSELPGRTSPMLDSMVSGVRNQAAEIQFKVVPEDIQLVRDYMAAAAIDDDDDDYDDDDDFADEVEDEIEDIVEDAVEGDD